MGASLPIGGWKAAAPLRGRVDFDAGARGGGGGRILAGSFRDPSGKLAGTFGDGARTIRGGFEGVLAVETPSGHAGRPRRYRGAGRGAGAAGGGLAGSWPDPSGKLAGTFGDGSGTVRGRFEVGSRAFWRRKRRQTAPATPAMVRSRARGEREGWVP